MSSYCCFCFFFSGKTEIFSHLLPFIQSTHFCCVFCVHHSVLTWCLADDFMNECILCIFCIYSPNILFCFSPWSNITDGSCSVFEKSSPKLISKRSEYTVEAGFHNDHIYRIPDDPKNGWKYTITLKNFLGEQPLFSDSPASARFARSLLGRVLIISRRRPFFLGTPPTSIPAYGHEEFSFFYIRIISWFWEWPSRLF